VPTHPPPRDRQNNHVKKRGALHHIYVQADLLMKERALEKLAAPDTPTHRFHADDALLSFLSTL